MQAKTASSGRLQVSFRVLRQKAAKGDVWGTLIADLIGVTQLVALAGLQALARTYVELRRVSVFAPHM